MVKIIVAFAFLFSGFVNNEAYAIPLNKNNVYIGANSSFLNLKKDLNQYQDIYHKNYRNLLKSILEFNSGFFVGYKVNPYLNLEVVSKVTKNFSDKTIFGIPKILFSSSEYIANLILPINKKIFVFTKIGAVLFNNAEEKLIHTKKITKEMYKKLSPLFSVGVQYFLNNQVFLDLNYNLKENFHNIINLKTKSLLNGFNIGISWKIEGNNINNNTTKKYYNKLPINNIKNIKNINNLNIKK